MAQNYAVRGEKLHGQNAIEAILTINGFDRDRNTTLELDASDEKIREQVDVWISEYEIPEGDRDELIESAKTALARCDPANPLGAR